MAYALVDDADYERLAVYRWQLDRRGYARRSTNGVSVMMHRAVLGVGPGDPQVDHINRDPLDNRRANLRLATPSHQQQNRGSHTQTSSRYRGVTWNRNARKWVARAQLDRRLYYLGSFNDEDLAGRVAAEWRRQNMPYSNDG